MWCVNEFLQTFLVDITNLLNNGIDINERKIIKFKIGHIVCDSPAKAFLLNVKSHNGYFGCTSCTQEDTFKKQMSFNEIDAPLRTDESFWNKCNEEYHKGDSPLELLPINIIDVVCLDYMHNVCIEVTKKLIEY